jgi:hypothetical protein
MGVTGRVTGRAIVESMIAGGGITGGVNHPLKSLERDPQRQACRSGESPSQTNV